VTRKCKQGMNETIQASIPESAWYKGTQNESRFFYSRSIERGS
jgi:hypothetical protein